MYPMLILAQMSHTTNVYKVLAGNASQEAATLKD
jgi:hypothetical protein